MHARLAGCVRQDGGVAALMETLLDLITDFEELGSRAALIGFWGCIARAAPVVPVDYRFSVDLVLRICNESQPRLLVHGNSVDPRQIPIPAISFDAIRELSPAEPLLKAPIEPEDIVEIVYTSGTTAEPKGVVHRHRNIVANLEPFKKEIEK